MSSETIWGRIREKPFRAFRVNTSGGKSVDTYHPEMIFVTQNRVTVAIYDRPERLEQHVPTHGFLVSPLPVASLEDIAMPQARAG